MRHPRLRSLLRASVWISLALALSVRSAAPGGYAREVQAKRAAKTFAEGAAEADVEARGFSEAGDTAAVVKRAPPDVPVGPLCEPKEDWLQRRCLYENDDRWSWYDECLDSSVRRYAGDTQPTYRVYESCPRLQLSYRPPRVVYCYNTIDEDYDRHILCLAREDYASLGAPEIDWASTMTKTGMRPEPPPRKKLQRQNGYRNMPEIRKGSRVSFSAAALMDYAKASISAIVIRLSTGAIANDGVHVTASIHAGEVGEKVVCEPDPITSPWDGLKRILYGKNGGWPEIHETSSSCSAQSNDELAALAKGDIISFNAVMPPSVGGEDFAMVYSIVGM